MVSIEKFKKSKDYRDICYFIDRILDSDFLISCLSDLGYSEGVIISKVDNGIKHVEIDKQNRFRVQVTKKFKNINISKCVIVDPNRLYF